MFTTIKKGLCTRAIVITMMISSVLLSGAVVSNASSVANSQKELQDIMRTEFENRSEKFTVTYNGPVDSFKDLIKDNYTVASNSSSYTRYSILGYRAKGSYTKMSADITMEMKYVATAEQEAKVETKTDEIIKNIITPKMSEEQKVAAINDYVIKLVDYDYNLEKRSAYTALYDKKAVCQGYALLVDMLLRKAKVETMIVEGTLKGGGHVWNKIKINGKWYNFDVTNNDTNNNKYYGVTDKFLRSNQFAFEVSNYPTSATKLNSVKKR